MEPRALLATTVVSSRYGILSLYKNFLTILDLLDGVVNEGSECGCSFRSTESEGDLGKGICPWPFFPDLVVKSKVTIISRASPIVYR
jgi:hypothetical protein